MKALEEFSLPLKGLHNGVHHYEFVIGSDFFKNFEESPIPGGNLTVGMELDKKPSMLVFDFDLSGRVEAICDRCLADINLPISGEYRLIVKYAEEDKVEGDVVYIHRETTSFNVAKYIHELACLSLPISKVYECEDEEEPPCDEETLERLEAEEEKKGDDEATPWDILKDIELN